MSFLDKLKAQAQEHDLKGKAEKAAQMAADAAKQAKEKAAEVADTNRDKVAETLAKAGEKVNEKTEGKYADKVDKATGAVNRGVDKLADQHKMKEANAAHEDTDAFGAKETDAGEPEAPKWPKPEGDTPRAT